MQIELHRQRGYFASSMALDVLADGHKLATLCGGQRCHLALPEQGAVLQVTMGMFSSPPLQITPDDSGRLFACGGAWWLWLDVASLCYLPPLAQRALFLRPA
ncbi:conserved hypothetical protein [Pseudomonas sp. OF001]|uniref:hypothetical protein n=1 Tax=Pseudomonas sp. OF001 TaxID=2772300 RepID=UPI00191B2801|nr:hypothetical protein [Pseudomonas sp. OF001]CAD5376140.1 conserved hypothetical protein [Pseudomonas sp. OF001]